MPERAQRKLVLQMGVSLDVMVALPDGDGLTPVLGGQWGLPTEDPELTELKLKAKPKTHATTWKQAAE